mmetsp:Transcript_6933/g.13179  ORF Transcript_6933/g.13179 Transcript_6933/m.13179 type:complete len:83 (+) Transcript_6933:671-919(+)
MPRRTRGGFITALTNPKGGELGLVGWKVANSIGPLELTLFMTLVVRLQETVSIASVVESPRIIGGRIVLMVCVSDHARFQRS